MGSSQETPETYFDEDFQPPVPVTLVPGLRLEELLGFPAFQTWKSNLKASLSNHKLSNFHDTSYELRSITIQSFDKFNPRSNAINFVKMNALVCNNENPPLRLPGIVFLRGGRSVAVLVIVRPTDSPEERWVVMVEQPRIAIGSLSYVEIPKGLIDHEGSIRGRAMQEMEEEVGMRLLDRDLIDMTKLVAEGRDNDAPNVMYPSPMFSDEWVSILLWEKEIDRQQVETLKRRLTRSNDLGGAYSLRLLNYEKLLEVGTRDASTLAAWSLYEYLTRNGQLP
ncbi:hypothetical protein M409DRAFT_23811 [Zasmidium cellare ATCC 36951]|uniref:Nudix hydrolase domain-containing protein n=1 Tax=Zasmidium cellare ATCC 36951 TaxID=1080233 RepID=A0A6A6CHG1_ZASCE|nr:uncharacterized protein M409DRAFT_23811 [Zasmidium cellare ATCC 36951]KAF2166083.1 hypothetical protein M409DRAFT_23811 [Zasmidium cellare ATCC 36951]